jgi:antitoxin (DNA-binding transcriptional repressor) of toxin-antitoxin stability system
MTIQFDIKSAPSLAELIARVNAGDTIVIEQDGRPLAQLSKPSAASRKSVFGALKGKIRVSEDFNESLSENELKDWGA